MVLVKYGVSESGTICDGAAEAGKEGSTKHYYMNFVGILHPGL
jgi:hypothetical protein